MITSKFGQVNDYKNELKNICNIAKKLRGLRGDTDLHWWEPAEWGVKYSHMKGSPALALTITLSPTGCSWAKNGGCTMCGEYEGAIKNSIPDYIHIAQFSKAIAELSSKYKPTWLRINQEGNYANVGETAKYAQTTILKLATQIKGLERVTIESRPGFLTENTIKEYSEIFLDSGVELEIGMGFEAADSVVRNVCVNKGESIDDFKKALNLMDKYGILSLAYVLLKPPFLSEKEAIDESVSSIKIATEIGFKRISLEPMSIHKYTVVDALARLDLYQVPWLWSVIDVVKQCKDIPELGIGGIGYYPRPFHLSRNHCECNPRCDAKIWEALRDFGKNRDFSVFDELNFECKEKWEKECQLTQPPLKQRIQSQISKVNIKDYQNVVEDEPESEPPQSSILIAGGAQISHVSKGSK